MDWPGRSPFVLRTNAQGFREDLPTPLLPETGVFRVIALGDSHTDGVATNAQTWPNVLEQELVEKAGYRSVEVINAGVGYYGPDQWADLGLELQALQPSLYIVAMYLGNDFLDAVAEGERRGELRFQRPSNWWPRLERVAKGAPGPVHQALNQQALFAHFPDLMGPAVERTERALVRLGTSGVPVWVVPLPPRVELSPETPEMLAWEAELELKPEHRRLHQRLEVDLREAIEGSNSPRFTWIDPRPALEPLGPEAYWPEDHHLAPSGLLAVGRLLATRPEWASLLR